MSGECNKSALSCSNPCNVKSASNTAACEALASQIENFTLNFFGEVFKTEVNGEIQWSLPGRLDVGLPLNPRGAGEPLGCYFLRMFQYGVVGARGEQGRPGLDACNGSTPYVQVLVGFGQQPVDVVFPITVSKNPSILPGMDVFIDGSGWYEIITSDGKGNITIALRKSVVNPVGFVPVGTVLLPSGKVGSTGTQGIQGIKGILGVKGPKGDTGDQGPQGDPAPDSAVVLPLYKANIPHFSINYPSAGTEDGYEGGFLASGFQNVVLFPGAIPCTVTLAKAGTYLVMSRVGWGSTPLTVDPHLGLVGAQANPGLNYFRLKNISTNTVIPQSTVLVYTSGRIVTFISTVSDNNVIQLQAEMLVGAGVVSCKYLWAFRIS